ncbi:MAG: transcription-repair coupling factor [Thermotogaceae bacterium]|nr:transcription-repair coupling factor [Thermotogaceae bacterium]
MVKIIILPHERLESFKKYEGHIFLPDHDGLPFSENSAYVNAMRVRVLYHLLNKEVETIHTTLAALSRYTISPEKLAMYIFNKEIGDKFDIALERLVQMGYERVDIVRDFGEFSIRGDVFDIFIPVYDYPVRIELFDDEIEEIRFFDPLSQRSVEKIRCVTILPAKEYISEEHNYDTVPKLAGSDSTIFEYVKDAQFFSPDFDKSLKEYERKIKKLKELATEKAPLYFENSLISTSELLKRIKGVKKITEGKRDILPQAIEEKKIESSPILDYEELSEGDIVVHKDYGIGKFEGIQRIKSAVGERDFLKIKYSDATLYVPVDRLNRVHKYLGSEQVSLDSLRSAKWRKRVRNAKKDIERRVKELVSIYAKRTMVKSEPLVGDPELEEKFALSFPYIETSDQLRAIEEVLNDLVSEKPMDRLITGDSGYGKTEVAMRAAFRVVVSGKQVAVMAPTVVLANQHYRTFKERMEPFGIKVELLDSTKKGKTREKILEDLKSGEIDIIIGTHTLLNDKIKFSDLGLVIIDEEQKFGVEQKDKFKKMRLSVNVLSMSATPIPRTLHMALSGMRDISTIKTPPIGRKPVTVYVEPLRESIIKSAILRELARDGQVIYVHNRVEEIESVYKRLIRLVPDVIIGVAHGQMNKRILEKTVEAFLSGDIDVLLCTTVIESGVDIGTANTIIIDDAHRYGLSQLYQLRGRVGRRQVRGYAYFLYPPGVSKEALKRLEIIKTHLGAGSGLEIALRDLEIRGYGDILGIEQSGHIESIGYRYYVELLNEAISRFKNEEFEEIDVEINGFPGDLAIPEGYISDPMERLRIYRRISSARSVKDLLDLNEELEDRFGKVPGAIYNLLRLGKLRIALYEIGARKVEIEKTSSVIYFDKEIPSGAFSELKHIMNPRKKSVVLLEKFSKIYEFLTRTLKEEKV